MSTTAADSCCARDFFASTVEQTARLRSFVAERRNVPNLDIVNPAGACTQPR